MHVDMIYGKLTSSKPQQQNIKSNEEGYDIYLYYRRLERGPGNEESFEWGKQRTNGFCFSMRKKKRTEIVFEMYWLSVSVLI